jgi:hypothetical protein
MGDIEKKVSESPNSADENLKSDMSEKIKVSDERVVSKGKKRRFLRLGIAAVCLILIASSVLIYLKLSSASSPVSDEKIILKSGQYDPADNGDKISSSELDSNNKYAVYIPQSVLKGYTFSEAYWHPKTEFLELFYKRGSVSEVISIYYKNTPAGLKALNVNDIESYDVTDYGSNPQFKERLFYLFNPRDLTIDVIKRRDAMYTDDATGNKISQYTFSLKSGNVRIGFCIQDLTVNLNAKEIYNQIKSIPALKGIMK